MQAIEIEPVDANPPRGVLFRIVIAEPLEEAHHDPIAPHPAREPHEVGERVVRGQVGPVAAHPSAGARRVRPIRLQRHDAEAARGDERLGDVRARMIELVRPVRGLADQHHAGIADQIEDLTDAARRIERDRMIVNGVTSLVVHHRRLLPGTTSPC
jgi:hypothetical protein